MEPEGSLPCSQQATGSHPVSLYPGHTITPHFSISRVCVSDSTHSAYFPEERYPVRRVMETLKTLPERVLVAGHQQTGYN
jgi:hypothetical protein